MARTFRIYVSSTFNDLRAERNALNEYVFPRLKELGERYGARCEAVDMRWGVSEEASLDQRVLNIQSQEIRRCQEASPGSPFVVLLGDRYGWRPPPPQLPGEEFEAIRELISEDHRMLLAEWYVKDDNAVPPEYCLKERTGEYEDWDVWDPIETSLVSVLRSGAEAIGLDFGRRIRYGGSATEHEIAQGVFEVPDAQERVFCFFRRIANLDELIADIAAEPTYRSMPDEALPEDFIDLCHPTRDRTLDHEAREQLDQLKQGLRTALPENVHDYQARWTGTGITTDHVGNEWDLPYDLDGWLALRESDDPPRNFCVDAWGCLSTVILDAIRRLDEVGELDHEAADHKAFGEARTKGFAGRADDLDRLAAYIRGSDPHPMAIHGASGSGKSTLMARAAEQAGAAHPDAVVVRRFIAATAKSSNGPALLQGLCQEISRGYDEDEAAPIEYRDLVRELSRRLALATADRPLILFLDGLDELGNDPARSLLWLPRELPEDVRAVVSALTDSHPHRSLLTKLPAENLVELRPMTRAEGAEALAFWLEDAGRTLKEHQRAEVLDKFVESEGLPMHLKVAFEEARQWRSFTSPVATRLTPTVRGILRDNLFARLSRPEEHGDVLVSRSLGYLVAAKEGLTDDELLDLLSADEEMLRDFWERSPRSPATSRLPVLVWRRLYFDLEPYLAERVGDGSLLLWLPFRQLREVVQEDYLAGDDGRARHRALAEYFDSQPLAREALGSLTPNLRKMAELPYQLATGEMWDELHETLTDPYFLHSKAENAGVIWSVDANGNTRPVHGGIFQLEDDLRQALESSPDDERRRSLEAIDRTIRREVRVLLQRPDLLWQQL